MVSKTCIAEGKIESSTYGLIDSQSSKTVYASDERGFDGGKNERQKAAYRNQYYGEFARR